MSLLKNNLLVLLFLLLVSAFFVKSALNGIKFVKELSYKPIIFTVSVCPFKTPNDFKNTVNGEYMYALYRYESMGVVCSKK